MLGSLKLFHSLAHWDTVIKLINHSSCCSGLGSGKVDTSLCRNQRYESTRLSRLFHRAAKP